MKSLILIPSYLWKNTFKRWFENPISPLSKILVPALLGLLAILVLVFFATVESQLRQKLKDGNSYDVYITEQVPNKSRGLITEQTIEEEELIMREFSSMAKITYLRQPFAAATYGTSTSSIPVFIYGQGATDLFNNALDPSQAPEIWLLTEYPLKFQPREEVHISQRSILTTPRKMPDSIKNLVNAPQAIAIPIEMAQPILDDGFITHAHARFQNLPDLEKFLNFTEAYFSAENRPVRTFSSIEILQNLQNLQKVQTYIRLIIIAACGIILAIILGTIAWLEYRQEAYLLALLRSFGTPRIILLAHTLIENLILVFGGIFIAFKIWRPAFDFIKQKITDVSLAPADPISLPTTDASIIFIAAAAGVIIAMIPVAFGLRKSPGLILQ